MVIKKQGVGFIGLGLMGKPMAEHIMKKGYVLYIWGRDKNKYSDLIRDGAVWCANPSVLAAKIDVCVLCVTSGEVVKEILFGIEGFFSTGNKRKVIIEHSTLLPSDAMSIATKVKLFDSYYLDAPVTGSVVGAQNASLVAFMGGDKSIFKQVEGLLGSYCCKMTYMGDNGAGLSTKMCNQIVLANILLSAFEMVSFANNSHLPIDKVLGALQGGLVDSKGWRLFCQSAKDPKAADATFIKNVVKDLRYIVASAKHNGTQPLSSKHNLDLIEPFIDMGLGGEDVKVLNRLFS
ncbi:NAD(P)-dependent oxidoreductase [uncultured Shewanella sp.]|uniref:NAD(P)-dependent oxidoreductase n=1 Tax=uncultured Shewanella sp. TaxID=173975 RepID=UPI00260CBDDE|nr:NAD(P)-dependent oxidoreductase [uncultured Shewanella sp.]